MYPILESCGAPFNGDQQEIKRLIDYRMPKHYMTGDMARWSLKL